MEKPNKSKIKVINYFYTRKTHKNVINDDKCIQNVQQEILSFYKRLRLRIKYPFRLHASTVW